MAIAFVFVVAVPESVASAAVKVAVCGFVVASAIAEVAAATAAGAVLEAEATRTEPPQRPRRVRRRPPDFAAMALAAPAAAESAAGRLVLCIYSASRRLCCDAGLHDAPWPPQYPKQPDEPSRVAPSRARKG